MFVKIENSNTEQDFEMAKWCQANIGTGWWGWSANEVGLFDFVKKEHAEQFRKEWLNFDTTCQRN
jgi:hypothetical protein